MVERFPAGSRCFRRYQLKCDGGQGSAGKRFNNAHGRSAGCTDTNNNSDDFKQGSPTPRNTHSPINPCSPITLRPTPQFAAIGVTNAASFTAGAIAPGEIITIFGSNLGPQTKSLGGTRVFF